MTTYERRGGAFAVGMLVLYAVVVGFRELAISPPLVVTATIGVLSIACGFAAVYFLARAFGERLTT